MNAEQTTERLREAGVTAWRAAVLVAATAIILVLYIGMAVLVYRGGMSDGALILFTGVILGYLLRAARELT